MTIQEAKDIVLAKFASTNSRANHVLPMRTLRFGVMQRMTRTDQETFITGINSLIEEGLITYESPRDGGLEVLRLTETGYDQLYQAKGIEALKNDIMAVFRRKNINPNEIIMMRYFIQSFVPTLNPKDQDHFTAACNELINEGKLRYEDGTTGPECLRLIHY